VGIKYSASSTSISTAAFLQLRLGELEKQQGELGKQQGELEKQQKDADGSTKNGKSGRARSRRPDPAGSHLAGSSELLRLCILRSREIRA
jgi:hypothetical protein